MSTRANLDAVDAALDAVDAALAPALSALADPARPTQPPGGGGSHENLTYGGCVDA